VDKLVKVWRKNGQEAWLLLHIEVQNREQEEFSQRMYIYSYRLFDRYARPVASLAILGDNSPDWRPVGFGYDLFGTGNQHRFRAVKLLDYESQWEKLEQSTNPFAVVVMVHLRTLSTQGKVTRRLEWKLNLAKELSEKGWPEDDVLDLFRVMDWMMALPPRQEQRFESKIKEYEEETKMIRYAPFEQRAMARGKKEGKEEGKEEGMTQQARLAVLTALDVRFGPTPEEIQEALGRVESKKELEELLRKAMTARSLEEFQRSLKP